MSGRRLSPWFAAAVVFAGAAAYYYHAWHSLNAFVLFLDHCPQLFCDFQRHFYLEGRQIIQSSVPVHGYFYSSFFALLLLPFGAMPLQPALVCWGIVQVAALLALFLFPFFHDSCRRLSWPQAAVYTFFFLFSSPMLHNLKWGQISVLLVLGMLIPLYLYDHGNKTGAILILGVAIAVKYYPAILLIYFLARRDVRVVAKCAALTIVLMLLPSAVLGFRGNLQFYLQVHRAAAYALQTWIPLDPNSQFFPYVVRRLLGNWVPYCSIIAAVLAIGICVTNAVLLLRIDSSGHAEGWGIVLLFTMIPFLLRTSWPHYLVYLPLLQLLVLRDLWGKTSAWSGVCLLQWGLLACSVIAGSSVLLVSLLRSWVLYSWFGCLCFSNLCLVGCAYATLLPNRKGATIPGEAAAI